MATKEVSNFTDEELSRHIQECLHRIKRDEAFMEGELASSDYEAIKKGVDKEILHKFLQYVAKCMQLKKKAFGKLEEKLYEGPLLQQEIAKLDSGVEDGETKTKKSKKKSIKVKKEKEEEVISEQEEIDDDPVLEPKKRNRSNNGSATKEGKKKGRMQISFSEAERKRYSQEARKEYNAQKADVLSRLPQSYKKHWGQIMFGRWKKDPWRPVLIVGPYEMAPAFRETWMKMFENVSQLYHFSHGHRHMLIISFPRPKVIRSECGNGAIGMDLQIQKPLHNRKSIPFYPMRRQKTKIFINYQPFFKQKSTLGRSSRGLKNKQSKDMLV
jgi:hypothetical protein